MTKIQPASGIAGSVQLPGDKSISHRYGMLAAIAEGTSTIRNYASGADCQDTLKCVAQLGAQVENTPDLVTIRGNGLYGWRQPSAPLDAGNSGTIMRMLTGLLAAQPFTTQLVGDESVSGRPMDRIIKPLAQMGARIEARDGRYAPLTVHGGRLNAIHYDSPVASAQVKSAVLFGGLFADGITSVSEPTRTRDHTELALKEFGVDLDVAGTTRVGKGPGAAGRAGTETCPAISALPHSLWWRRCCFRIQTC